jgi:hypothetical protein
MVVPNWHFKGVYYTWCLLLFSCMWFLLVLSKMFWDFSQKVAGTQSFSPWLHSSLVVSLWVVIYLFWGHCVFSYWNCLPEYAICQWRTSVPNKKKYEVCDVKLRRHFIEVYYSPTNAFVHLLVSNKLWYYQDARYKCKN